jgi:hypothetical protein
MTEWAWEAFLPLEAEGSDWARALFLCTKDEVAPLVRRLRGDGLQWFSFLVHVFGTGLVPTTPDDKTPYLHLRLVFDHARDVELPPRWIWLRRTTFGDPVPATWLRGGAPQAWALIARQAEWLVELVESLSDEDGKGCLRVAQFLHYAANMTQIAVA